MNLLQNSIISLVHSALSGERFELPEDFSLEDVLPLIEAHRIETLAYYGAVNCGIPADSEPMKQLFGRVCMQVMQSNNQMLEIEKLCKAFEENGVDYLPVKGTLIKSWYKKPELRYMSDADILIKVEQYDKIKPIMQSLGYDEGPESLCELIWNKPWGLHAELHKSLIPPSDEDFYSYFGTGWERAKRVSPDNSRYELSDEDHFIFVFAHFTRHYRSGGIGIKHMADLWVYSKVKTEMDFDYIAAELKKLGLYEFYLNIFKTLKVWFDGGKSDSVTDLITTVIFGSGAYGVHSRALLSDAVKRSKATQNVDSAKRSKTLWLVFLPYKYMCLKYPFLKKLPFLLPVMWVVRGVSAVLFRSGNVKKNFNEVKGLDSGEVEEFRMALEFVGLKL